MAISKEFLSGSTNGRPIRISTIATPGTLLHTAHATAKDELYLFATNVDTTDKELTVEFGGNSPEDLIKVTVPTKDTILVVAGVPQSNSQVVRAFCITADVVNVFGYVNRIS